MKIERFRNVSKSEMFPCSAKEIKVSRLCEIESLRVLFGLNHRFNFNLWDYKIPNIEGRIIAEARVESSINSNKNNTEFYKYFSECTLYLFPIKIQDYSQDANIDFCQNILPTIYDWFQEQTNKPENARLKASELFGRMV